MTERRCLSDWWQKTKSPTFVSIEDYLIQIATFDPEAVFRKVEDVVCIIFRDGSVHPMIRKP